MTLIPPDKALSETVELLQSLHNSVRRIRQQAEFLCRSLQNEDDDVVGAITKQIAAVDGLIRICQKVEANLVEQQDKRTGIAQGGYALDLEEARTEIRCQLDRLRACRDAE